MSYDESLPGPFQGAAIPNEKVKVSENDTTANYLDSKLVAGSNITLTEQNDGENEVLEISAITVAEHDPLVLGWSEGSSSPYIQVDKNSYTRLASLVFNGTGFYGNVSAINITAWTTQDNKNFDIRIVDITNNLVVAELADISNETETILDMGTLNNLSVNKSVWEVQGRKGSGLGAFASIILYF